MVRFPRAAVVVQLTGSNKSEWKAGAWILSCFWPLPSLSPALAFSLCICQRGDLSGPLFSQMCFTEH